MTLTTALGANGFLTGGTFAQLIIRECADLVDHAISDGGIDGLMIKEHFGIEK